MIPLTEPQLLLKQAAEAVLTKSAQLSELASERTLTNAPNKPSTDAVVEALLQQEKQKKKARERYTFEQFLGNWRLCFITGTKKTRRRMGVALGAGRYLPKWVKIELAYSSQSEPSLNQGRVKNSVQLGGLKLSLTGPVKWEKNNILAFDFTRMKVELFGVKVYEGDIRGGASHDQQFYTEPVSKQAFFAYFLVCEEFIAARGRGGGLALWGRFPKN